MSNNRYLALSRIYYTLKGDDISELRSTPYYSQMATTCPTGLCLGQMIDNGRLISAGGSTTPGHRLLTAQTWNSECFPCRYMHLSYASLGLPVSEHRRPETCKNHHIHFTLAIIISTLDCPRMIHSLVHHNQLFIASHEYIHLPHT